MLHLMAARIGKIEQLLGETVDALDLGRDEDAEPAAELRVVEAGGR